VVAAIDAVGVIALVQALLPAPSPAREDVWRYGTDLVLLTGTAFVLSIASLVGGAVLSGSALALLRVRQAGTIAVLGTATVTGLLLLTGGFLRFGLVGSHDPAAAFVPLFVVVFVALAAVLALPPWAWWIRVGAALAMSATCCGCAWMLNAG
jgi:hypothetical protein